MNETNTNMETGGPAAPVLTEVTSVAQEEAKTGQKVEMPSREELVARASSSMIVDLQRLNQIINKKAPGSNKPAVSRNAMNRILLSIMQLPTGNLPVTLKSDDEKIAFALGQKLISSRFILMQDHISRSIAEEREKENNKQTTETVEIKENEND